MLLTVTWAQTSQGSSNQKGSLCPRWLKFMSGGLPSPALLGNTCLSTYCVCSAFTGGGQVATTEGRRRTPRCLGNIRGRLEDSCGHGSEEVLTTRNICKSELPLPPPTRDSRGRRRCIVSVFLLLPQMPSLECPSHFPPLCGVPEFQGRA